MSFRINTNTQAALSLSSLNKTTDGIGKRQLRLATGSRINSAADDSAGFTISNKLVAKTRGQAQALSNIGDAKSMLTVAEGSLNSTMDILQTIKEKAVQAGNSSMGAEERAAIQSQVDALTAEVSDILSGAEFNGTTLFSDTTTTSLSFQVGDSSGDTFGATVNQMGVETLGIGTVADADIPAQTAAPSAAAFANIVEASGSDLSVSANPSSQFYFAADSSYTGDSDFVFSFAVTSGTNFGVKLTYTDRDGASQEIDDFDPSPDFVEIEGVRFQTDVDLEAGDSFDVLATAERQEQQAVSQGDFEGTLNLMTDAGVAAALTTIDAAIASVSATASGLGDVQNRLDFKAQNLETSMNNYDAANSRIADADFAKEQMEIVKLQILQQTGSAMFAQSNAAPQSVLSFF